MPPSSSLLLEGLLMRKCCCFCSCNDVAAVEATVANAHELCVPSSSAMAMMWMMLTLALIVTTAALLLRCGVYFNGSNGAALQQHATFARG